MRYTLKDYQSDAVAQVLSNLRKARNYFRSEGDLSQFSLSATTGAGKTVMAAAVIEALFFGSDEYDFAADRGAVVLWFSDDPALNEQSRGRIQSASSELDSRLQVIETSFSEQKLRPGHVYFLNAQKLSKNSRLVRGEDQRDGQERLFDPRPDEMQHSIYDVITETIQDERLTLYFVLDEAHRGMSTKVRERTTIVQRLINGHNGVLPMPIVWGISATVDRFETAMMGVAGRIGLPSVEVDSALVQASGLLKDDIVLGIPTEAGAFDTVLLKRAVRKVLASTKAWADYSSTQDEADTVVPLLVIQVPDKADTELFARAVNAIYDEWPHLPPESFAHVFGEHTDLLAAQIPIPYLSPERVQEAKHIRVLFAKTAISTGWDCPRAEVLVSFRPAQDRTHITQLLGRMIRTPLARRVPGNEVLNSVDCLLPFFDRKTATEVAHMLMQGSTTKSDPDSADAGGGLGRRVLFDPVAMAPNPQVPEEVWEVFESIPTHTLPKRGAKPIKRLTGLAHALSEDHLVEDAGQKAHAHLHAVLDGRAVQYADQVQKAVDDVTTMEGEEMRGLLYSDSAISRATFSETADHRAIQDAYRAAGRIFSADLARTYVGHLAGENGEDDELREATVRVAALSLVPEIAEGVEEEADRLARKWLAESRVARKGLSDERQGVYDDLEAMSTTPQPISLTRPKNRQEDTWLRDAQGNELELPVRTGHLLCAEDGTFPLDLNDWETAVLDREMGHPGFVAWWRNPSRAVKESLAIAYKDPASNDYKALRPDFIFFSRKSDGQVVADIVDPHGYHLADAMPKLRGLAEFSDQHGNEYGRIEAVAKVGDTLRVLDLKRHSVREAIRHARDAETLYAGPTASDY